MALRLSGDDDRVIPKEPLDEWVVSLPERLALAVELDLRSEHRVVLREGIVTLRLEVEWRPAGDGVEEERLLDRRDEREADPAEHGVEGPDGEAVLAALLQRPCVVAQVLLGVIGVEPETLGCGRADPPASRLHVSGRHRRERVGMTTLFVDEHDRVEDLERLMCVEGRDDLRQPVQVAVDELAQPA